VKSSLNYCAFVCGCANRGFPFVERYAKCKEGPSTK